MDKLSLWWSRKRITYNIGLVVAGIVAFITYGIVGAILIMPYDSNFEITLFTTLFQSISYLIMMGIANICFYLGPITDKMVNKKKDEKISRRLFYMGFWFSVFLPFLIPIMLVVVYFIKYAN